MFTAYKMRDEGLVALQHNKYNEAAKLFEEATSLLSTNHPDKGDFLCFIAKAHFLRGDYLLAIEFSGMALKLKENYPPALYRIGLSLCGMRRYSEGIHCMREAGKIDPRLTDKVNAKLKDVKKLSTFYEKQERVQQLRSQQRQHPVQIRKSDNFERSFVPSHLDMSTREPLFLPSSILDSSIFSSTASVIIDPLASAPSKSSLFSQQRQLMNTCVICEEQFDSFHLNVSSNCHLQSACSICIMRLRTYYEDFRCLKCFQVADVMICTKDITRLRDNHRNFTLDPTSKLYFPIDYYNRTVSLLHSTTCQVCLAETSDHGALLRHLANEHDMIQCKLCTEYRSKYPFERQIFNKEEYCVHLDYSDCYGSHGHPTCQECRMRFFDHDYLLLHIKLKHPLGFLKISATAKTRPNADGGTRHLPIIINSYVVMSVSWMQAKRDLSAAASAAVSSSSVPILPPGFDDVADALAPPGSRSISATRNNIDFLLPLSTPSSSSSILTSSVYSYSNSSNDTRHNLLGGLLSSSTNYLSSHSNAFGYDLTDDISNNQLLFCSSSNNLDPYHSLLTNLDLNKDSERFQRIDSTTTSSLSSSSSSSSNTPTVSSRYLGNAIMNSFFSNTNPFVGDTLTEISTATSITIPENHPLASTAITNVSVLPSDSITPEPPSTSLPEEEERTFLNPAAVRVGQEVKVSPLTSASGTPSPTSVHNEDTVSIEEEEEVDKEVTPSNPPRIEDDELPEDVFPCVDWLRERDMCMFKWSGTEEEWTEYALNLPSPVFSYLKKDDSHIIRDIAEQTECAIRNNYEYLRGAKVPFLVFTRGPSGAPSNIAMETALEITSNMLRDYFSDSGDSVWGRRLLPKATNGNRSITSSTTSFSSSKKNYEQILYEARINVEARIAADSEERRKKAAASKNISLLDSFNPNIITGSNNRDVSIVKTTRYTQPPHYETSEKNSDSWISNKQSNKPKKSETKMSPSYPEKYVERAVEIPRDVIGKVIGQNGKKIKEICAASGARIHFRVNKAAEKDGRPGLLEATGHAESVEKGLFLVRELLQQMEKDYIEIPYPNIF